MFNVPAEEECCRFNILRAASFQRNLSSLNDISATSDVNHKYFFHLRSILCLSVSANYIPGTRTMFYKLCVHVSSKCLSVAILRFCATAGHIFTSAFSFLGEEAFPKDQQEQNISCSTFFYL